MEPVKRLRDDKQGGPRKARRCEPDDVAKLKQILGNRRSYEERVQGQIAMQDGPTGLGVLSVTDEEGNACTDVVEYWIYALCHPQDGFYPFNMSEKDYKSIPFYVSPKLWQKTSYNGDETVLEDLLNKFISAEVNSTDLRPSELFFFQDHKGVLPPLPRTPISIKMVHVTAKKGDLVLYRTLHCNASCEQVTCVHHLDYFPYDAADPDTLQMLRNVYQIRSQQSCTLAQGNGNKPVIENEYYREQGLPEMPTSPLAQFVLGKSSSDLAVYEQDPELMGGLTQAQKTQLRKVGHLVVSPPQKQYLDLPFSAFVDDALCEFERFFNYALFRRIGVDKYLSFDHRDQPLWEILRGEKKCLEHTGDRKFLNLATKQEDGSWKHAGTAQGGQSNATISCGMGHATNFYRGYHSLQLSCHPFVVGVFQDLYNTPYVHNCCERWRVKCGTGKKSDNASPRANRMPIHSDTLPPKRHGS